MKRLHPIESRQTNTYVQFKYESSLRKYQKSPAKKIKRQDSHSKDKGKRQVQITKDGITLKKFEKQGIAKRNDVHNDQSNNNEKSIAVLNQANDEINQQIIETVVEINIHQTTAHKKNQFIISIETQNNQCHSAEIDEQDNQNLKKVKGKAIESQLIPNKQDQNLMDIEQIQQKQLVQRQKQPVQRQIVSDQEPCQIILQNQINNEIEESNSLLVSPNKGESAINSKIEDSENNNLSIILSTSQRNIVYVSNEDKEQIETSGRIKINNKISISIRTLSKIIKKETNIQNIMSFFMDKRPYLASEKQKLKLILETYKESC